MSTPIGNVLGTSWCLEDCRKNGPCKSLSCLLDTNYGSTVENMHDHILCSRAGVRQSSGTPVAAQIPFFSGSFAGTLLLGCECCRVWKGSALFLPSFAQTFSAARGWGMTCYSHHTQWLWHAKPARFETTQNLHAASQNQTFWPRSIVPQHEAYGLHCYERKLPWAVECHIAPKAGLLALHSPTGVPASCLPALICCFCSHLSSNPR